MVLSLPPYLAVFADLEPSNVYVVLELSLTIVNFLYLLSGDISTCESRVD